ncbi:hypothetical protein LTR10_006405 [Elasticomyces elasticus]|nr:hypothetical protein LTR10_006405 [Elasticomyces elasticus]KAK4966547.1 hypothetical protein LTR42_010857 [Elasticomyces elasticus]
MAGGKRRRDDTFKPSRDSKKDKANISSARPTTRLTTKHSAFNAVFLTTELLENILGQLPMKDLLLAQRVSRKWRDVIVQSKGMQQQLFMLPIEAEYVWDLSIAEDSDWFEITRSTGDKNVRHLQRYLHTFNSGNTNELLVTSEGNQCLWEKASPLGAYEPLILRNLPSLDNPDASWRRMLLSQPPSYKLYTQYPDKDGDPMDADEDCPNGVTMSDAVEPIEEAAAVGRELNYELHFLQLGGFVVMTEEDQDMMVINGKEWNKRNS